VIPKGSPRVPRLNLSIPGPPNLSKCLVGDFLVMISEAKSAPRFQPDYIRNIFKFEIDGKEVTEQEKRDDMLAKELAEKSAMTYADPTLSKTCMGVNC